MLNRDDTHIHRLHVRGPQAAVARVSRALQQAHWPQAQGEAVVLLRQVRVQAEAHRLSEAVLQQTRQCVEHSTDPANVMRFTDMTALVAALLTDLAQGQG